MRRATQHPMPIGEDRLLSYAEAAALVGRDARTIRRWVKEEKLRAVGFGRSRWIRESDLLRALGVVDAPRGKQGDDVEKDDA